MAPINTVQNEGFRKMINTLDKRYTVPSRNYFSIVALPALYTQCRATVETEFQAVQHFAATTKRETFVVFMFIYCFYVQSQLLRS